MWTDILGLRPVFRELGQRLAAEGYVVLVPNPFYRNAKAPVVDGTFDFSKPEDRAKVMPMAAALTADANISDAKAYVAFLDAQPQTNKKKKMGVQGYCMGGPLTFRTAATRARSHWRGGDISWRRSGDRQAGQPAFADSADEGRSAVLRGGQRRQARPGGQGQAEGGVCGSASEGDS